MLVNRLAALAQYYNDARFARSAKIKKTRVFQKHS